MAEIRIINCHTHTFTTAHTPRDFPHPAVALLGRVPGLLTALRWIAGFLPWQWIYDFFARLENFHRTGSRKSQRAVMRELLHFYPRSSRHVVLPLDMAGAGHGPLREGIVAQHDELFTLSQDPDYGAQVIPFATIDPDAPGGWDEFRRAVESLGFRGLKLYPKLGYRPDHPVLMEKVYPYCQDHGLPVVSHCSRGGIARRGWSAMECDLVTAPDAFAPVLDRFPRLRVSLAHFGGLTDWDRYLRLGFDPDHPASRKDNWVARIMDMIEDEGREMLWTDISYTLFRFGEFIPLLRLVMEKERLRRRILFGSDFYMTRQEDLSEKAVSIRLRDALGEDHFRQIAEINPAEWLGNPTPPRR